MAYKIPLYGESWIYKGIKWAFNGLKNLFEGKTGAHMTDAEKEASALSLENQQILNEQEYERKIDFYERFESPEAQVRQYQQAGLNPMLLANGGASVSASGGIGSAGSAPAQSQASSGFLTGLLGQLLDYKVAQKRNDIAEMDATTRKNQSQAYIDWLNSRTSGQNITNSWLDTIYGADVSLKSAKEHNLDVNSETAIQQRNYLMALTESAKVKADLDRKNIEVKDMELCIMQYQKGIMAAQSRYADQYFKAVAELNAANALMASVEGTIFEKTQKLRLESCEAELNHIIIRAGMDAKIFTGEGFSRMVQGKQSSGELLSTWLGFGKSVLNGLIVGGAMVGSAAIKAAATRAPAAGAVAFPGTMPQFPSPNPYFM